MTSEAEIKQYKQFTTITNIRKITQEAMNPIIKSLQKQLNQIFVETDELKKRTLQFDDVTREQKLTDDRITDVKQLIREFKDQVQNRKKDDDKRFQKNDKANQRLVLEIESLKTMIKNQDEILSQIKRKNDRMNQLYHEIQAKNQNSIKDMQYKYTDFTKQVLELNKTVKLHFTMNQAEMEGMKQTYKRQRQMIQEKTKAVELFFGERELVNSKIEDISSKLLTHVSQDDFNGYRLAQKNLFKEKFDEIQKFLNRVLPETLQDVLPIIEQKIPEIDKIPNMYLRQKDLIENVKKMQKQFSSQERQVTSSLKSLKQRIKKEVGEVSVHLQSVKKEFFHKIDEKNRQLEQKFATVQEKIKEEVEQQIQRTSSIYKTIEEQLSQKKSSISHQKHQQIVSELAEVQQVSKKILSRYNRIESISDSLDKTLLNFHTHITKIRSDNELFTLTLRKEMRELLKFKGQFQDRLSDIGGVLANYGEMLLMGGALWVQETGEKQYEVYVSDYDGIIYEWKPGNKGKVAYRKNKFDNKLFIKSYLHSMTSYIDDVFGKFEFLRWNQQKPSQFFKSKLMDNYDNRTKYQTPIKSPNPQPTTTPLPQPLMTSPQENPRIQNKTIEPKNKPESQIENTNCFETGRKTYSIKRQKYLEKGRYEGGTFLTSRSACKSRLSQVF